MAHHILLILNPAQIPGSLGWIPWLSKLQHFLEEFHGHGPFSTSERFTYARNGWVKSLVNSGEKFKIWYPLVI